MARDLSRFFRPRSIAVVGGGAWCRAVIEQCDKIGFAGEVWPVTLKAGEIAGRSAVAHVDALPGAPDATFIGVNREATICIVEALAARGAGGAVCFASGFREAGSGDLQEALILAAGEMPVLGPNCYGFVNYLDRVSLWPDQHGGVPVESGVAIIAQSSNVAINLTMQRRGLPLAYVVTVGNQAQTGMAEVGSVLLEDPRVTALGLYVEGFGDLRALEGLAAKARALGKRIVAIKTGITEAAQSAAVSHTASLAGGDVGATCLMKRLGIARAFDLASFLDTLKLFHVVGPLPSNRVATMSCSGGEASLAADTGAGFGLEFPPLSDDQQAGLVEALGSRVDLANPLDYHTYIWRNVPVMTAAFSAMVEPGIAITMLIADFPRPDRCDPSDWDCVLESLIAAREATGARFGLISSLPETLPEEVAAQLMSHGIVPLCGLREAMAACALAGQRVPEEVAPLCLPTPKVAADLVPEAEAKACLARHGLPVPLSRRVDRAGLVAAAAELGFPLVLKAEGLAHKTEAGAVALELGSVSEVMEAAGAMPGERFLLETMVEGAVAELLIGVVKDQAHGFVMTIGAGGTLAEVMQDSASFLLPASQSDISAALDSLRVARLLAGYRGAPAADRGAIVAAIRAVENYVLENAEGLEEVEVNPLICTATAAIAVDALLRRKDE